MNLTWKNCPSMTTVTNRRVLGLVNFRIVSAGLVRASTYGFTIDHARRIAAEHAVKRQDIPTLTILAALRKNLA